MNCFCIHYLMFYFKQPHKQVSSFHKEKTWDTVLEAMLKDWQLHVHWCTHEMRFLQKLKNTVKLPGAHEDPVSSSGLSTTTKLMDFLPCLHQVRVWRERRAELLQCFQFQNTGPLCRLRGLFTGAPSKSKEPSSQKSTPPHCVSSWDPLETHCTHQNSWQVF